MKMSYHIGLTETDKNQIHVNSLTPKFVEKIGLFIMQSLELRTRDRSIGYVRLCFFLLYLSQIVKQ